MRTTPAPVSRFDAPLVPAATAMVWCAPGRDHEPMAVLHASLAPGDALVEIELSTVCEQDVRTAMGDDDASGPLVLGHESVGRIVTAAFDAVDAEGSPLRPGDRVVWSVRVPCGTCPQCRGEAPAQCAYPHAYGREPLRPGWELSGSFATHIQLRAGTVVVKVAEAIPADLIAPLSCRVESGAPIIPDAEYAPDLRAAVRCVERAWRRLQRPETIAALPLRQVDDALALAARGAQVALLPR